jgi:hypothetical protein
MKNFSVGEIFTDKQLKLAAKICKNNPTPANELCEKITKPHLEEINRITGQINDAKYWAYALEYVINSSRK